MEEQYWNRFARTGKIADYLTYRGIAICKQVMGRCEGDTDSEPDYIDWDGAVSSADGGV